MGVGSSVGREAGEAVAQSIDGAGKDLRNSADAVSKSIDGAGSHLDHAADTVKQSADAISKSVDNAGNHLENSAGTIAHSIDGAGNHLQTAADTMQMGLLGGAAVGAASTIGATNQICNKLEAVKNVGASMLSLKKRRIKPDSVMDEGARVHAMTFVNKLTAHKELAGGSDRVAGFLFVAELDSKESIKHGLETMKKCGMHGFGKTGPEDSIHGSLHEVLLDVYVPGQETAMFDKIEREKSFDTLLLVMSSLEGESLELDVPDNLIRACGSRRLRILGQALPLQRLCNPLVFAAEGVDVQIQDVTRASPPSLAVSGTTSAVSTVAHGLALKATGYGLVYALSGVWLGVTGGTGVVVLVGAGVGAGASYVPQLWHRLGGHIQGHREV